MVSMLAGLTIFFFAATLLQLVNLNSQIAATPRLDPASLAAMPSCPQPLSYDDCRSEQRLRVAVLLEANLIERRHHEASVQLMASIWSRYLGFSTGMILSLVGAAFILGMLSDGGTNIDMHDSAKAARVSLATSSPGLVMVIAGVALMVVNITTLHTLSVVDAPIYFTGDGRSPLPLPLDLLDLAPPAPESLDRSTP
jgi:hypothetical protein